MKRKKIYNIILLVIAIILGFFSYRLYVKSHQKNSEKDDIVYAVGQLMILPDEDPILMEINSPDVPKKQAFFAKAVPGDKVLVFIHAAKAVVYSPEKNKIVNVGSLRLAGYQGDTEEDTDTIQPDLSF